MFCNFLLKLFTETARQESELLHNMKGQLGLHDIITVIRFLEQQYTSTQGCLFFRLYEAIFICLNKTSANCIITVLAHAAPTIPGLKFVLRL